MPEISVILPVYNARQTLEEAVESILRQTIGDWELLIIDDGSSDGSPEIIRKFAVKDGRVRPLFTEHHGIVSALNTGLEQARGTFIARMDADDIALPERFERQAAHLHGHPEIDLVSCRVEHLGDKQKKAGYARYVRWINALQTHEEIALNRFIESPLAHPSVLFRKSAVEQFGPYRDGPFPEDYELWLRWLEEGAQMEKVPGVLLKWRDEPGRLSRTHSRYSVEAFYRIKAEYLARWLEKHNPWHPAITVWGGGRTTRKRAEMLTGFGVDIIGYIDIDPDKIGYTVHGRPVIGPGDLPPPGESFVVSYVGRHGANEMIGDELESRGYRLGSHYIFAA